MEVVAGDGEGIDFRVGDLDALGIVGGVEFAGDRQAGLGGGCSDQFDDGKAAGQRSGAPVLRDVAKEPVLDLVPFDVPGG